MYFNGWTDTHAVHPYNGLSLSLTKKGNSDTCSNMINLEDIILNEISQSQKEIYCMILLIEVPGVVRFLEAERSMVVTVGAGAGRNRESSSE